MIFFNGQSPIPSDAVTLSPASGQVLNGRAVALTAKPAADSVFVDWMDAAGNWISRSASLSVAPAEDMLYTARFRLKAECAQPDLNGSIPDTVEATVGVPFFLMINVNDEALPVKFSATGLPAGLKIDAASGLISGVPTRAFTNAVTVTVTSLANTKLVSSLKPIFAVSALPAGAVGTFNGFVMDPDAVSPGSVSMGAPAVAGTLTLTATAAGKLTAKVVTTNATYSLSAASWEAIDGQGRYHARLTATAGCVLDVDVDAAASWDSLQLSGAFGIPGSEAGWPVTAQRNAFGKIGTRYENPDATNWLAGVAGDYAVKIAGGEWSGDAGDSAPAVLDTNGYATVTVTASGTATLAASLPDGKKVSAAGFVYNDSGTPSVCFFTAPYGKLGAWTLSAALPDVLGAMRWIRAGLFDVMQQGLLKYPAVTAEVELDGHPGETGGCTAAMSEKHGWVFGSPITLTAKAASSALFLGWYQDNEVVTNTAALKVGYSDEDRTFTALFRLRSDFGRPAFDEGTYSTSPDATVGTAFNMSVALSDERALPVKFSATGLPAGLKLDAVSGAITGIPTTAGKFNVAVKATSVANTSWTATQVLTFTVTALPDWAWGTFDGYAEMPDGRCGTMQMIVAKTGKITGKVVLPGTNLTFVAASYGVDSETNALTVSATAKASNLSLPLALTVRPSLANPMPDGLLSSATANGSLGNQLVTLWRNAWKNAAALSFSNNVASVNGPVIGSGHPASFTLTTKRNGRLSFRWNVSSEAPAGKLACTLDGSAAAAWSSNGWDAVTNAVTDGGTHTWAFSYVKGSASQTSLGTAWITDIAWRAADAATSQSPVPVPYAWLDAFNLAGGASGADYEAAATNRGANGVTAWESYVAGLVPTNPASEFVVGITFTNGVSFVTWTPDLGTARAYTIEGKTNLTDCAWVTPTNEAIRFYRVKVEMP